jgi:NACHT N-terminal Helical domain 1
MIELAAALTAPLAKLFLRSCSGEVPADIGDNLLKLGFARLGDWSKARAAKQLAERTAKSVVASLERFFESEHFDPDLLEVAATDLGATVGSHLDAAFLVDRQLDASAIEAGLLAARPLDRIYPKGDPVSEPYVRLARALAPRLREIAPKLPHYEVERDAEFFAEFSHLADGIGEILAEIADIKPTIEKTAAGVLRRSALSSTGLRSSDLRSTSRRAAASLRSPTCRCARGSACSSERNPSTSRP